jgi:phosphoglycolate phosphatase
MNDSRIRMVAFDLDGTLIDSLPGIKYSIGIALAQCGFTPKNIDLRAIIGPPIRDILGKLTESRDADLDRLENAFRCSYDNDGWRRTDLYPETSAVLTTMHDAGFRLFVVTNKPLHISMRILERTQIGHRFERVITRDSRLPHYASKDEMLNELLASCDVPGSDCLFVGDTEEDSLAAAKCGVKFAHATYGYGTITEIPCFAMCSRISDLSRSLGMNPIGVCS